MFAALANGLNGFAQGPAPLIVPIFFIFHVGATSLYLFIISYHFHLFGESTYPLPYFFFSQRK